MTLNTTDVRRLNTEVEELWQLRTQIDSVLLGTPTNVRHEKEKVLAAISRGESYSPVLEYDSPSLPSDDIEAHLERIGRGETAIDELIRNYIRMLYERETIHLERSGSQITSRTLEQYGAITPDLLNHAQQVFDLSEPLDEAEDVTSVDAASKLRLAADAIGLASWIIVERDGMHAKMSVSARRRRISVRTGATFTERAVQRLVVHELGTHAMRAFVGDGQPLTALRLPFGTNAPTDEGLAVYNEERLGCLDPQDQKKYALRVLASEFSLRHSFSDLLTWLLDHGTQPEVAVDMAFRCKRGFAEPAEPGTHLKDTSYFRGWRQVSEAAQDDKSLIADLYTCKQPIERLPLVRSLLEQEWLLPASDPAPILREVAGLS